MSGHAAVGPESGAGDIEVDDDSFRFLAPEDGALDVLFDGRRIWSIAPAEHPPDDDGYRRVSWPAPIRARLDGRADVELRTHSTGVTVASVVARFGSGQGRVEIVDARGRPVALTKYGRVNHPFETTNREVIEEYLDLVDTVLDVLRDECGLPAFLSYGSLLGAVRSGRLIGHDVDVDLGYLSWYDHPVDVARETFRVERVLRDHGWQVSRQNGGFLAIFFRQADGTLRNLDIFTCFITEGMLYQLHDVRAPADRSAIVPLGEVELEGRRFPAPAHPEVLLKAAYGAGWRVPDPAFSYHTPRQLRRRLNGWLVGARSQRDAWLNLYLSVGMPSEPTDFARLVLAREEPGQLVDVGCGNGRDTLLFAEHGFSTTGLDFIRGMVRAGNTAANKRDLAVDWRLCNLYLLPDTLYTGLDIGRSRGPRLVYSRGLLHDLTEIGQTNFWRLLRLLMYDGGRCYLEFWTELPPGGDRRATLPIRRVLDPTAVAAQARAAGATAVESLPGGQDADSNQAGTYAHRMVMEW